jgi:hypothetical protein
MIQEYGCIFSTNGRSHISVSQVYDYYDIPAYPKTSLDGIAHFVTFSSPIIPITATLPEVIPILTQQMSKVSVAYAKYMPICFEDKLIFLDTILS